jgi:hypothetical protein
LRKAGVYTIARDHIHKGVRYVTDALSGFTIRITDAVKQRGKWVHRDRVDAPSQKKRGKSKS